ncbi:MAG: AsmA family protein [Pseudomonadota bacterium]
MLDRPIADHPAERRKTRFSILRFLALVLAGFILLMACFAAYLFFYPPGWMARDLIIRAVEQETGRTLTIGGKTELTLRPSIRLSMEEVTLSGHAGEDGEPIFSTDQLETDVQVVDLWNWQFEVPAMSLVRPVFRITPRDPLLVRLAEGKINVGGIPQETTLKGGVIAFVSETTSETIRVEQVTGLVTRTSSGQGLSFDGELVAHDQKATVDGSIDDIYALANGNDTAIAVMFDAPVIAGRVNGSLATQPIGKFNGDVDVKTEELPQLMALASVDPGQVNLGDTAALRGKVNGSLNRFSLLPATITLESLEGVVTGEVSLDETRPAIKGSFATSKLDINTLLPEASRPSGFAIEGASATGVRLPTPWDSLMQELQGPRSALRTNALGAARVPTGRWSSEPFTLKEFPDLDVDLAIKADEINYGQLLLKNGQLGLRSNPKRIEISLDTLELYEGSVKGRADFDLAEGPLKTGLRLNFKQLGFDPLVAELLQRRLLSGTGDLDVSVDGKGGSMRELVGSLDGTAAVNANQGAIIGYDLRRAILSFGASQPYDPARKTRFSRLKANVSVRTGVLRSTEDLRLTGPDVDVTARGSYGLVSRWLDQRLLLSLQPPPIHLPIPLRVQGDVDDPEVFWDLFSAAAEPNKYATPFSVGSPNEKMPPEVRSAIEAALSQAPSKRDLSIESRTFLEGLLATR